MNVMSTPFCSKELEVISLRLDKHSPQKGSALCNHIFGFNNWSSEIRELRLYFTTEEASDGNKVLYSSGASAICRVVLRDGSHRDAVGSGESSGVETKMKSIKEAQQAAIEEGIQRCVEQFQAGHLHEAHPMQHVTSTSEKSSLPPHTSSSSSSATSTSTACRSTINNFSGQKRGLPQAQSVEQHPHTPFSFTKSSLPQTHIDPHSSSTIKTPQVQSSSSASPTLEDIDSLMQQYDQVQYNTGIAPVSTTTITTGTADNHSKSKDLHSHAFTTHSKDSFPYAHPSLKGQKYPPQPNLQDPFEKQKK